MRGRVAVPLLLILCFGPALSSRSDCNLSPVYSGQFRSTIFDLAIDGSDLWVATGYGIALYDRSATPPAPVASISLPGVTNAIRAGGGYAFAGSGTSLFTLQKDGTRIRRVQRLELGGTTNDLLLLGSYLFVAGSNGVTQISLADPRNPAIAASGASAFPISGGAAYSFATDGSTLWVADGDATVEAFNASVPALTQRIGSFPSLPRSTSVKLLGQRLLVSDGQQTDMFSGSGVQMVRLATLPTLATTAVASIDSNIAFVAGNGRRISAVDFSVASSPVALFTDDEAPGGGTVNRILKLAIASGRLYAGGGDLGLLSYDISRFASPYPLHSYSFGWPATVAAFGATVIASNPKGLQELTRSAVAGTLTTARSWDAGHADTVQDMAQGLVLTSSGPTLTLWSLFGTNPTIVGTATLRATVRSAVLSGAAASSAAAWAVLDDHSLFHVDMAASLPTPSSANADNATPSSIARYGSSLALADLNADGTTTIRYFPTGDPAATMMKASLRGTASSGITLSQGRLAAFTFEGAVVVDFRDTSGPPIVTALPLTRSIVAEELLLDRSTLFLLSGSILQVWNIDNGKQLAQLTLPSSGISMAIPESGSDTLIVGMTDGVATFRFGSAAMQPSRISAPGGNAYYGKIAVGPARIYLFDGSRIDSYALSPGGTPSDFETLGGVTGTIDLTATTTGLAVLSSSGVVTSLGPLAGLRGQLQIDSGSDMVPLSITSVGGAIWASVSTGCISAGRCDGKTIVFDDRGGSLAQTATMSGAVVALAVSGNQAYAITDLPSQIRVIDLSDPYHPVPLATRTTEGNPSPVSIAISGGTVYVLGEKLYAYSEGGLTNLGEILGSFQAVPAGPRFIDQTMLIDGGCALVAGRSASPQFYSISSPVGWTAGARPETPAAVRSMAQAKSTMYLLTDDSLEILSSLPQPKTRRRAAP